MGIAPYKVYGGTSAIFVGRGALTPPRLLRHFRMVTAGHTGPALQTLMKAASNLVGAGDSARPMVMGEDRVVLPYIKSRNTFILRTTFFSPWNISIAFFV